jgi:hypothetical protein
MSECSINLLIMHYFEEQHGPWKINVDTVLHCHIVIIYGIMYYYLYHGDITYVKLDKSDGTDQSSHVFCDIL